ncbi:hypothetical protein MMN35_07340 [Helicobacter pylori]|uniref:RipA family octameric membrane protein n=2 Tax=Helicobacter pylori TaxID=210 RepID=UPI0030C5054F
MSRVEHKLQVLNGCMALNLYNDNLKPLNNDTALLEQYKIAINSAEKISDRRATANNFFIALNSVLFSLNNIDKLKSFDDFFSTILLCFSILICLVWIRLLKHYKEMNGVKFEIINLIEQKLPCNFCQYEWHLLQRNTKKKKEFTRFENYIPQIFIGLYIFVFSYHISLLQKILELLKKYIFC